eukprot:scaffold70087_cov20-Prasinocladus_malaysianus.AAC.1
MVWTPILAQERGAADDSDTTEDVWLLSSSQPDEHVACRTSLQQQAFRIAKRLIVEFVSHWNFGPAV